MNELECSRSERGERTVRWLARSEDELPGDVAWLAPSETARAAALRYPKRRTEFLIRRLAAKHAVVAVAGLAADSASLATIEVRNAPGGAPYVLHRGERMALDISLSDRAGWAVCVCGTRVGCDLEVVEPRSDGFVRDFMTESERRYIAGQQARDAAANLIWSAKESALKVLRTGLASDTRSVEVTISPDAGDTDGWARFAVHGPEAGTLSGWWRHDGAFLLTVAAPRPFPPPTALEDPRVLAAAVPRHSWVSRPPDR
jgi:4'-phosphopantetheinyl transferase